MRSVRANRPDVPGGYRAGIEQHDVACADPRPGRTAEVPGPDRGPEPGHRAAKDPDVGRAQHVAAGHVTSREVPDEDPAPRTQAQCRDRTRRVAAACARAGEGPDVAGGARARTAHAALLNPARKLDAGPAVTIPVPPDRKDRPFWRAGAPPERPRAGWRGRDDGTE